MLLKVCWNSEKFIFTCMTRRCYWKTSQFKQLHTFEFAFTVCQTRMLFWCSLPENAKFNSILKLQRDFFLLELNVCVYYMSIVYDIFPDRSFVRHKSHKDEKTNGKTAGSQNIPKPSHNIHPTLRRNGGSSANGRKIVNKYFKWFFLCRVTVNRKLLTVSTSMILHYEYLGEIRS